MKSPLYQLSASCKEAKIILIPKLGKDLIPKTRFIYSNIYLMMIFKFGNQLLLKG